MRKVEAKVSVRTERINQSSIRVRFSVWNTGKISFRSEEVFWHVLIDKKVTPQNPDAGNTDELTVENRSFMHFKGMLDGPVFPNRHNDCFSLTVQTDKIAAGDFLYYLSTAYGVFPRTMKISREGVFNFKTVGTVHIMA